MKTDNYVHVHAEYRASCELCEFEVVRFLLASRNSAVRWHIKSARHRKRVIAIAARDAAREERLKGREAIS